MQHIPVVGWALWRGTLILKMLDMVPTVQSGSYHQQDLCLFTVGESLTGAGGEEGGEWQTGWGFCWFTWGGMFQRALEWFVLTSRDSCVALHLGQCIRERWRDSGSSVHSVGRARIVSHPSNLSLFTPHHTPSSPLTQPASCLFSCSCFWPKAWWTDGKVKTSYPKQTILLCYQCFISKFKQTKLNMLLCHIRSFFSTSGQWREILWCLETPQHWSSPHLRPKWSLPPTI